MLLSEIYRPGHFGLSFEIFPPKTTEGDEALRTTLADLARYRPAFISCTYGAGGSTRNRTIDWCAEIQQQHHIPATAHFTCVGSSQAELLDWLKLARQNGVENIMALRGDPPQGQTEFRVAEGGLKYANELVGLIREHYGKSVGIGVAGYPEKHPEAPDLATDLMNLQRKVAAGADAIFTQLFYANDHFYRFWEKLLNAGVAIPVVPGIMPITEFARIKRITAMCGAFIPAKLAAKLEWVQDDKEAQAAIGVEFAIEQCRDLIAHGIPGIHFYVLNKSQACQQILDGLGVSAGKSSVI